MPSAYRGEYLQHQRRASPGWRGGCAGWWTGFLGRSMPSMLVSSPTILWSSYRRGWSGRRRWEASTVTSFASGQSAACRRRSIDCAARIHASDLAAKDPHPPRSVGQAYQPRQAAYDLKKLRGKKFVSKIGNSRRYEAKPRQKSSTQ